MLGSPAPLPVRVSAACPALCRAPGTSGHRLRALGAHGLVGSSEPITRTTAYLSPWRVTSATKSGRTVPPWLVRRGSGWPEAHRRLPHGRKNHARTGVKPGEGGTGAREAAAPEEVKELQEGCSRAGGPAGTGPAHLEARQGAQVVRGDGEELPRRQGQIRVRNVGCGWHPPRPVGPAAGRRVPSGSQAPSRAGTAPAGADALTCGRGSSLERLLALLVLLLLHHLSEKQNHRGVRTSLCQSPGCRVRLPRGPRAQQ